MKKLLMMVVALFATLNMNAQGEAGGMFVKPMAGLTYSTITKSDAKMKLGFAAGAEFGYNFTENITFTGGLLYTMEGAKRDYRSGDLKTTLGYLNIPILFNYYVIPGLALKTGIQPGILLSQKTKIEVDNYETENIFNQNSFMQYLNNYRTKGEFCFKILTIKILCYLFIIIDS